MCFSFSRRDFQMISYLELQRQLIKSKEVNLGTVVLHTGILGQKHREMYIIPIMEVLHVTITIDFMMILIL